MAYLISVPTDSKLISQDKKNMMTLVVDTIVNFLEHAIFNYYDRFYSKER